MAAFAVATKRRRLTHDQPYPDGIQFGCIVYPFRRNINAITILNDGWFTVIGINRNEQAKLTTIAPHKIRVVSVRQLKI